MSVAVQSRSIGRRVSWASRPEIAPFAFLILLCIGLSLTTRGFLAFDNLISIVAQVAVVGTVALAVNLVIMSGEIDVSTGSLLAACSLVFCLTANVTGGIIGPLVAATGFGAVVGSVSGLLVTFGGVPSIIATLGMLLVLRGLLLVKAAVGVIALPDASRRLGVGFALGLPVPVLILAAVYIVAEIVTRQTTFGRDVLAIGSNGRAARFIGLPIARVKLLCFVLSGASCGIASGVFFGQIGQLQATAATGFELRVIAAVVLGGTSITGGRGSVVAPVLGAILVGVILNGMALDAVPETFEQFIVGLLILVAISLDAIRRRLAARRA
jgi:ribose/xylose/arabinose/galactoside ABC-type transport system permease subunit